MVNPQFGNVQLWGTRGNATYHSFQLQLRKQISQGFSGQFSYTWSKALGDSVNGDTVRDAVDTIDPRNRSMNKGRLSFDRAQTFRAHGTWELPFGSGRALLGNVPAWMNRIVGGWQVSSIFTHTSGGPLTITSPNRTVTSNYIAAANISLPDIVGNFPKSLGKVQVGNGFVEYFPVSRRGRRRDPTSAQIRTTSPPISPTSTSWTVRGPSSFGIPSQVKPVVSGLAGLKDPLDSE